MQTAFVLLGSLAVASGSAICNDVNWTGETVREHCSREVDNYASATAFIEFLPRVFTAAGSFDELEHRVDVTHFAMIVRPTSPSVTPPLNWTEYTATLSEFSANVNFTSFEYAYYAPPVVSADAVVLFVRSTATIDFGARGIHPHEDMFVSRFVFNDDGKIVTLDQFFDSYLWANFGSA